MMISFCERFSALLYIYFCNGEINFVLISLQEFLEKIFSTYSPDVLSYFEMNLETWRQLWRVLEMSDIMLMIVDIRYPVRLDTCIYTSFDLFCKK